MSHLKYISNFDGVRCLAVIFVLLTHGCYGMFKGGWVGVDLFFVLSGYLITRLLYKEYTINGKISLLKFYTRRALRLYPALIIFVILTNLLWPLWPYLSQRPDANQVIATLSSLFYLSDCVDGKFLGPMLHLWSLSVEEHFYMFWPIAVSGFLFSIHFRKQILFSVILILFVSLFRIWVYNSPYELTYGIFKIHPYYFTLCRIDTILMGGLLALLEVNNKLKKINQANATMLLGLSIFCLLVVLVFLSSGSPYWLDGGFVLINILCFFTVLISLKSPDHPFLSNAIARWIGQRSYGIYLYHVPVFYSFESFREVNNILNLSIILFVKFTTAFIISDLSFRFVEQPILKFKKKYTGSISATSLS